MACNYWLGKNRVKRRLVYLSLMSSRNCDVEEMDKVQEFFEYSWKLEENKEAVKIIELYNSANDNLDFSDMEMSEVTSGLLSLRID